MEILERIKGSLISHVRSLTLSFCHFLLRDYPFHLLYTTLSYHLQPTNPKSQPILNRPLQVIAAEVMKDGDESLLADEMGGLLDALLKV